MLFMEDFLPKDEPVAEPVAQTPKVKSQRELDKEKAAAAKAAAEANPEVSPPVEETPAVVETPTEEAPAVVETPVEETPAVVETPVEETPAVVETPTEETPAVEEPALPIGPDTDSVESTVMTPEDNASEDQIGAPDNQGIGGGDLTDKILEDLEKQALDKEKSAPKKRDYVAPPDYEYAGRGLVYNCVGKHWACVDAPSYKTCEQNSEGNKALNKKVECYPFNVYEKMKNCQAAQLMMTSSNAKTGFCNE